jgi:hypothetical protein
MEEGKAKKSNQLQNTIKVMITGNGVSYENLIAYFYERYFE